MRLKRLSDIENNEVLDKYCETFPYQKELFTNQKTNGFPENYVGVWNWRTIPNINDPSRDYIESEYNAFYQPTQVIILKECTSIEQIVKKLVMGISEKMYCNGALFAYWNGQKYEGVRCREQDLDIGADRLALRENTLELPVFEIFLQCFIKRENVKFAAC